MIVVVLVVVGGGYHCCGPRGWRFQYRRQRKRARSIMSVSKKVVDALVVDRRVRSVFWLVSLPDALTSSRQVGLVLCNLFCDMFQPLAQRASEESLRPHH